MNAHYSHYCLFFFFNDTATTEIYTLSLHDALPISTSTTISRQESKAGLKDCTGWGTAAPSLRDRKSTRLNSSHQIISYAVFCLKKKIHTWTKKRATIGYPHWLRATRLES